MKWHHWNGFHIGLAEESTKNWETPPLDYDGRLAGSMHTPVTVELHDPLSLFIYDTVTLVCLDFCFIVCVYGETNCVYVCIWKHLCTLRPRMYEFICMEPKLLGVRRVRFRLWLLLLVCCQSDNKTVHLLGHIWWYLISFFPALLQTNICPILKIPTASYAGYRLMPRCF